MSAALARLPTLDQRPSAKRAAFFRLRPDLARAFARRGEIGRLVDFRRQYGVALGDLDNWSLIVAELAAQKTDLDIDSFQAVARGAGIEIDVDMAMRAIRDVAERRERQAATWRQTSAANVARMLDVTAEERCMLDIRTIGAVDETVSQRKDRLADERRERDRLRKRLKRAEAKRIRAERVAGEVAEAASQKRSTHIDNILGGGRRPAWLKSQAPWLAMGISRATYYRRRKAGREAQAEPVEGQSSPVVVKLGEKHTIGRQPDSPRRGRSLPSSPAISSDLQPGGTVLAFASGQPVSQNDLATNGPISRGCGDLGYAIRRALRQAIRDDEAAGGGRSGLRALWEIVPAAAAEYQGYFEKGAVPDRRNILRSLRRLVERDEVAAVVLDAHVAEGWRKGDDEHCSRPVVVYRLEDRW